MRHKLDPLRTIGWAFLHDVFVFVLHGAVRRHGIVIDTSYEPPKPVCLDCANEEGR